MSCWSKFEDLVLEFMEARVAELLDQGGVIHRKSSQMCGSRRRGRLSGRLPDFRRKIVGGKP
jgi:hypothetical protein